MDEKIVSSKRSTELYPSLLLSEKENYEAAMNKSRIDEMSNKRLELDRQLKHYLKIKKRWDKADGSLKITGTILAGTSAVVGAVIAGLTVPLTIPIVIPIVLGAITAGETIITSGLVMGLTGRKKSFYREKINIIQSYIDKMFVYSEKARQDGVITVEELEGFKHLMEEYQNTINSRISNDEYDYEKIKREAEKEAKKEAEKKLKDILKRDTINSIVHSRYSAATGNTLRSK
jgi:hypothetical protein